MTVFPQVPRCSPFVPVHTIKRERERARRRRETAPLTHGMARTPERAAVGSGIDERRAARSTLVTMILGTYREMPGLSLSLDQAARLFGLRETTCRVVLRDLVDAGRLCRSPDGHYRAYVGAPHEELFYQLAFVDAIARAHNRSYHVSPRQEADVHRARRRSRSALRQHAARAVRRRQRRTRRGDAVFDSRPELRRSRAQRSADGHRHRRTQPPGDRRRAGAAAS